MGSLERMIANKGFIIEDLKSHIWPGGHGRIMNVFIYEGGKIIIILEDGYAYTYSGEWDWLSFIIENVPHFEEGVDTIKITDQYVKKIGTFETVDGKVDYVQVR